MIILIYKYFEACYPNICQVVGSAWSLRISYSEEKSPFGGHIMTSLKLLLQEADIAKVRFDSQPLRWLFPSIDNSVKHLFFLLTLIMISYMTTNPCWHYFWNLISIRWTIISDSLRQCLKIWSNYCYLLNAC